MRRFIVAVVLICTASLAHAVCPSDARMVPVGQSIQAAVSAAPTGAKFCIGKGTHRGQSVVPKDGQQFYLEVGAQMLGSKRVTGWVREGALWFVTGQNQTPPTTNIDECAPGYPLCNVALGVFHANVPLHQVASKAAVNADTFYHDKAAARIYIGRDPTKKAVEVTTTEHAFSGRASNVLIKGGVIRWYGPRLQRAAIHGADATGWTIDGVRVLMNYAVGVDVGSRSIIRNSVIRDNGELGIACGGTGITIERNRILNNGGWSGLHPEWEGGGFKCTEVYGSFVTVGKFINGTGLTVNNNTISGNKSVGAWIDEGRSASAPNSGVVIRNNLISDNDSAGISIEISRGPAKVIANRLIGNGVKSGWFWGGCLQSYDSMDVEAKDNLCDVAATHGAGMMVISQGGREVNACGNNFHHNTIILRRSGATTGATGDNLASFCKDAVNRFDHNRYFVPGTAPHWAWQDDEVRWDVFRAAKNEANGTMTVGVP